MAATATAVAIECTGGSVLAAEIFGAGASFPAPLYTKWAEAYDKATGRKIHYESIGSVAGIKQIRAGMVDFGASDMPIKSEDLGASGMIQFPVAIGGIVAVVNIPGIRPGQLRLTGALLADIFMGKLKRWNAPAITALNPGANLPDQDIFVVHRADGSGSTFIFTNYLSKVSPEWKEKVGEGGTVQWPVGLGGKGNEGVAAIVQRMAAAIGYVEYSYAKQSQLTHTQMRNAAGAYVQPEEASFKAAAANAVWDRTSFYEILTNQPGTAAWPITGATFVLMSRVQEKPERAQEALKFFDWAYRNGEQIARDMDYVSLPANLVADICKSWADNVRDTSGRPLWPAR